MYEVRLNVGVLIFYLKFYLDAGSEPTVGFCTSASRCIDSTTIVGLEVGAGDWTTTGTIFLFETLLPVSIKK